MDHMVETTSEPPRFVVSRRTKGSYVDISMLLSELFQFAMGNQFTITGPPGFLTSELNEEEAEKADMEGTAELEVFLPIVDKGLQEVQGFEFKTLPGGNCARIVHKGPYDKIGVSYDILLKWLEENKKKLRSRMWESYVSNPHEVKPEDLITEIYAPIK